MTAETAVVPADADRARKLALMRAIGLDKLAPEQRELVINIATKYELDLLLKHVVLIEGRAYITRDGLLHVAHRSGQLDGIVASEPEIVGDYWRATCSVYRKDMSRAFTYTGRYPTKGGNARFAPEMAVKVAEVMCLRRAFDVSMPTAEERWDMDVPEEPSHHLSLADRVAERRATIVKHPPAQEQEGADPPPAVSALCLAEDAELATGKCERPTGHADPHRNATGSWPA